MWGYDEGIGEEYRVREGMKGNAAVMEKNYLF